MTTGLYCPGCHQEFHSLEYNDPHDGDIIICTQCAELGAYTIGFRKTWLQPIPMTDTRRTPQIEARQVKVFADRLDHTIARLLHPSTGPQR